MQWDCTEESILAMGTAQFDAYSVLKSNIHSRDHGKRERRAAEHIARKSGRNQLMRDLAREVAGAPDEVRCPSTWLFAFT